MRTTAMRTTLLLVPTALASALLLGCRSKPLETQTVQTAPAPISRNFTGLWEGRDKKGAICTIRFINAEWESHMAKDGAKLPYYRGTYTFAGSSLELRIIQEGDPMTNEWVAERGNFPKNIFGSLVGGKLRIPALTEAELVKKY